MTDEDERKPRVHEKFNASDSDVTMESADGVLFCLHTQNLRITTGAFPGSEFSTEGEPTKLTEDSNILEVIFTFVYPQRHPSLEDVEFSLLAKIAEAVEKYEIFPATHLCSLRMKQFLPQHADDILAYGVKHGYPKLINEAALSLSRSPLMGQFTCKFSLPTVLAWIRYSESWKGLFRSAIATIEAIRVRPGSTTAAGYCDHQAVCETCKIALFKWVLETEKIASLPALKNALTPSAFDNHSKLVYCGHGNNTCCSQPNLRRCTYMLRVARVIQDGIDSMLPFQHYLANIP